MGFCTHREVTFVEKEIIGVRILDRYLFNDVNEIFLYGS